MKSLAKIAQEMPAVFSQAATLVWGTVPERVRAADALASSGDRRVLPILCERLCDPDPEVVAVLLARIDLLDPITGVLVAREMICGGRSDHLGIARAYLRRSAPWELRDRVANPRALLKRLAGTEEVALLRRALLAPNPVIRLAAARRLAVIAEPDSLRDLADHLDGYHRVPADALVEVLLPVRPRLVWERIWNHASCRTGDSVLLDAVARAGGRGTQMLLALLRWDLDELALGALLRYRPHAVLEHCQQALRSGNLDRALAALSTLGGCFRIRMHLSPLFRSLAFRMLEAALEQKPQELQAAALHELASVEEVRGLRYDVRSLLHHRSPTMRCGALEVLAAQRRSDLLRVFETARKDRDPRVRATALRLLGRLDRPRQLERVRQALFDESSEVLEAAVESLPGHEVPASLCEEGCHALREIGGEAGHLLLGWLLSKFPENSTTILLSALRSPEPALQEKAAEVLFGCEGKTWR